MRFVSKFTQSMKPTSKIASYLLTICATCALAADKPNIVLLLSDDQSWTDYSFMGHPHVKTPHIDTLAGESIEDLCAQRDAARARKDFATADALRDRIAAAGVTLQDSSVKRCAAPSVVDARVGPALEGKAPLLQHLLELVVSCPGPALQQQHLPYLRS